MVVTACDWGVQGRENVLIECGEEVEDMYETNSECTVPVDEKNLSNIVVHMFDGIYDLVYQFHRNSRDNSFGLGESTLKGA